MKIRITKLKELPDALHSFNIEEGFVTEGEFIENPEIGECFWVGDDWRTSWVHEIIDEHTFRTCNSIYRWEEI